MTSWVCTRNALDLALVTADREVGTLPASRVKTPQVARRYRAADLSNGDTRSRVEIDFTANPGGSVSIDTIVWVRPRQRAFEEERSSPSFATSDLVKHQLANVADFSATVYDSGDIASGIVNGYGYHVHLLDAPVACAYAAFEFDALSRDTPPDNFVDWGVAFYGRRYEFPIGFAAPQGYSWREGAARQRSADGGSHYIRRKKSYRVFDAIYRAIKNPEYDSALDLVETTADGGRFVFGLNKTDPARSTIIGVNASPGIDRTSRAFSRLALSIEESL